MLLLYSKHLLAAFKIIYQSVDLLSSLKVVLMLQLLIAAMFTQYISSAISFWGIGMFSIISPIATSVSPTVGSSYESGSSHLDNQYFLVIIAVVAPYCFAHVNNVL